MLVSEYISHFLRNNGTKHIFGYPGGMVTYLMDALEKTDGITAHVNYHEQGAAFAACGYALTSGKTGAAYATSGPGATNLITGIAEAYFDSVPVIFITGQVNTYEARGIMKVRQKGFQETDIVSIARPVTKFAVTVNNAKEIRYYLEKSLYLANFGRKGPVLIDVPMNVQRTEIDPAHLLGFMPNDALPSEIEPQQIIDMINSSQRPCIIVGAGVKQSGKISEFRRFIEALKIPVLSSMIAVDVAGNSPYSFGFVGAYGNREANFILSKSDMILSIGSRLDCRQTGANRGNFAVNSRIIRLDADVAEFENSIHDNDMNLFCDLKKDMKILADHAESAEIHDFSQWLEVCKQIRDKLRNTVERLYPQILVEKISEFVPDGAIITTDVGQNQVWIPQYFAVKPNQRILFSGGMGAMGFSLPAAIGAALAHDSMTICFVGDGGLMMNLQELQFVARERLPLKICLLNNSALGMIRHFQEMYFDSRFVQTMESGGYSTPNFEKIAAAFGIPYKRIDDVSQIDGSMFCDDSTEFIEFVLPNTTYVFPKLAVNKPIQDQEPPIDRELYRQLDEL